MTQQQHIDTAAEDLQRADDHVVSAISHLRGIVTTDNDGLTRRLEEIHSHLVSLAGVVSVMKPPGEK
jgi:hypothetical protein